MDTRKLTPRVQEILQVLLSEAVVLLERRICINVQLLFAKHY